MQAVDRREKFSSIFPLTILSTNVTQIVFGEVSDRNQLFYLEEVNSFIYMWMSVFLGYLHC